MGNNNSTPRVTVKAKGRGPIPPAIANLQNPEYLNSGFVGPTGVMTSTYATSGPMVPTVPVAAPIAPPMMATATTTDTVISGPMLPPRLPPVPVIDHPMQPGIYGATAVGPSVAETYVVQHQPFVPGVGPAVIDETTVINATAPIQPGMSPLPSPQPSPQASLQQQQFLQQQQQQQFLQQQQLLQEEQYFQQQQQQQLSGRATPPLPAGYADQTQFYQGAATYPEDFEASDDDTASYSSFDEEIFVAPAGPANLRARSYTRRSPNFVPTGTIIRDSPPPAYLRESPQPGGFLRASPPLALRRESPPLPLSARTRASYAAVETPYEPYSRSRAFDRYQVRVNSRMSAYDQTPDQYGFYPNAYRI